MFARKLRQTDRGPKNGLCPRHFASDIMGSGWSNVAMFTEVINVLDDIASVYNGFRILDIML